MLTAQNTLAVSFFQLVKLTKIKDNEKINMPKRRA